MENLQPKSADDLRALLRSYDISATLWGVGKAKTIEHLLAEIESGECVLQRQPVGLVRTIHLVAVEVFHVDGDVTWKLREDRQEFKDGRVRRRGYERLGEKVAPGESARDAACRALREELGITALLGLRAGELSYRGPEKSTSYPGLLTMYQTSPFTVLLPKACFRREGYVEVQKDKTTHFLWLQVLGGPY